MINKKNYYITSILFTGFVSTLSFFAYRYKTHINKYNSTLPKEIFNNLATVEDPQSEVTTRILAALQFNKENTEIQPDKLNKKNLTLLLSSINSSFFHFSGNCALLSQCVLYNLKKGKSLLAAKNSYPIYLGIDSQYAEQIIFGKTLIEKACDSSCVIKLENKLLNIFNKIGERYFIIRATNYELPIVGRIEGMGHQFNAMVMGSGTNAYVQFIDAWKTSDHIPNSKTIAKRCKGADFTIKYYPGSLSHKELSPVQIQVHKPLNH